MVRRYLSDTQRLGCIIIFESLREGPFALRVRAGRMAQTAAHLVEGVMPWVPTRQWVVSVPIPLRYWTAPSRDLTAKVHGIIRSTIAQFYINQAVKRGAERQKVQPGSVTFLQRFGGALQLAEPRAERRIAQRVRRCHRDHRPGDR